MGLLTVALAGGAGCQLDGTADAGVASDDLLAINGLTMINGLTSTNGLGSGNGLTMINGLATSTGLSSTSGLMTTSAGRLTVTYMVRCALPAGHSITKKDQNGKSYAFSGMFGLAPAWETAACGTACQEAVSACMMSHVNVAGVHVPVWLDSPIPAIGFGSNATYPNEEGSFFGNLFVTGSNGKVPAYYCEGSGFEKGIVPGRLGATTSAAGIFTNPFGSGTLCSSKCVAASGSHRGQGYASCAGYTSPITVWRPASYRPVFDPAYAYRFVNSKRKLAMDVAGSSTSAGAAVLQYTPSADRLSQQFKVVLTAGSTWKLIAVQSGKAIVGTGSNNGSAVKQDTFSSATTDIWGIDDHNGHFKIVNKSSLNALESPGGSNGAGLVTSSYEGDSAQDWDIYAVVQ
jgi:Ricin-type beta-trefoil lectin domain-like